MQEQLGVAYQELDARPPQQVGGLEQRYFGDRGAAAAAAGAMPSTPVVPPSLGLSTTLNGVGVHHTAGKGRGWWLRRLRCGASTAQASLRHELPLKRPNSLGSGGQARWQAASGEMPAQGGPGGGGASWASPARHTAVEGHVLREAKALEDERLRSWIQVSPIAFKHGLLSCTYLEGEAHSMSSTVSVG